MQNSQTTSLGGDEITTPEEFMCILTHGTHFVENIGIRESKRKGYLDITLPDGTDIEFPDIFEGLHTPIAIGLRATRMKIGRNMAPQRK